MLSDMLYLTGRRNLSRKLLIVNFLGSVDMCTSGQNYRGGLLGFMEKKLKLRNSQKKCCTAPGGPRKALNRVGKRTIKTFLSCYSFLNSRSVIFSPTNPCPMSAVGFTLERAGFLDMSEGTLFGRRGLVRRLLPSTK